MPECPWQKLLALLLNNVVVRSIERAIVIVARVLDENIASIA
jgi:hypothetical protein